MEQQPRICVGFLHPRWNEFVIDDFFLATNLNQEYNNNKEKFIIK